MELDIRNVGEAWELLQAPCDFAVLTLRCQDDCKERSAGLTAEELVIGVAKLQGEMRGLKASRGFRHAKSLDLMPRGMDVEDLTALRKVIKEQNHITQKLDKLDKSLEPRVKFTLEF